MHLMNIHLIINCVLFSNEHKVQNQYMKEMLSKAFDRKQTTKKFQQTVKFHEKLKKDNLTVFEPKHLNNLNINCLKWDLKDSPICLDLAYFQPKNKTEKITFQVSLGHLSIFLIDAVNSFLKNASISHFKFVETRP